ncbi:MAG TPA: hypothetical protein VIO95_03525 [Mycobacterium sp.]
MDVVTTHPVVDAVLERYRDALGGDMSAYGNHVYRCLNYHQLLLGTQLPDFAVLAWVAHDLGIWTAGTFDYLTPSAELASAHAKEFGITEIDHLQRLITDHHRLRPVSDPLTETFRKADLVDVSRGLLRGHIGWSDVHAVVAQLPYRGFHAFLANGLTRYAARHPLHPFPMLHW